MYENFEYIVLCCKKELKLQMKVSLLIIHRKFPRTLNITLCVTAVSP